MLISTLGLCAAVVLFATWLLRRVKVNADPHFGFWGEGVHASGALGEVALLLQSGGMQQSLRSEIMMGHRIVCISLASGIVSVGLFVWSCTSDAADASSLEKVASAIVAMWSGVVMSIGERRVTRSALLIDQYLQLKKWEAATQLATLIDSKLQGDARNSIIHALAGGEH